MAALRRKAQLTQRQLAEILDVTIKTVSAWERGEHEPRLTLTQTTKLMEVFQCSLDELILVTHKESDTDPEEPRLTFTQTRRLAQVLDCSFEELAAAMKHWPNSKH